MLQTSDYEKIIKSGKRVDWYETQVPEKLLTPEVKAMANQIVEQINKYEGVESTKRNDYIQTLWFNVRHLPYTMNGDFYLIKKKEIEDKMVVKTKPKTKKESIKEVKTKTTKNSQLIFGVKK